MKKILINFVDVWPSFDKKNNLFYNILTKYYKVEISDNPEYIFYSSPGKKHLKYDCIRIFFTAECQIPDFNIADYAVAHDYLSFGKRYFRFPYYAFDYWTSYHNSNLLSERSNYKKNGEYCNRKFCNFIYSNNEAENFRLRLFEKLSTYKTVDSGGRFKNNIGKKIDDKIDFQKNYKFTIACENSKYDGYVTEKILHAYLANTVPIYWGDSNIRSDFNANSFVNCSDFENLDDLLDYIVYLDTHDDEYLKILNQNVFNRDGVLEEYYENLEQFLKNIFDPKIQDSACRNDSFWGKIYEQDLKKIDLKYILKSIIRNINRIKDKKVNTKDRK